MNADIETMLRETFAARAEDITPESLGARSLDDAADSAGLALVPELVRPRRAAFAIAAAVLLVLASAAVVVSQRDGRQQTDVVDAPAAPPATARAWPLNNDTPLSPDLASPDAAARRFLTEWVGLAPDWPLAPAVVAGDAAVAEYVLQDVLARISLARTADGRWFVTGAETDLVRPKATLTGDGAQVILSAGPRTYAGGVDVKVSAYAASGVVLHVDNARVDAAKPKTVSLWWPEKELPATIRVDVLDDIDGNPATPAAVVGNWTTGIAAPEPAGLPAGVDVATAEPVFSRMGTPQDIANAYLRDRFPDYPAPDVRLDDVRTRAGRAFAQWSSGDAGNRLTGRLFLRKAAAGWDVVAATTDGVDLSGVALVDGRLQGHMQSRNDNSLFADVLTADGAPVAGAPKPEGAMPDTAYRFGTAGGPADGRLVLDVAVAEESFLLRANLVGGTILSITEVRLSRSQTPR